MREKLELALKIVATFIAVFGIWKYFADREATVSAEAKSRALGYIERFGGEDMIAARSVLADYWRDYPEFTTFIDQNPLSERAFVNFVTSTYPQRSDKAAIDGALFRMRVFFDEIAFCREAGICDKPILDGFFCDYAMQHARIYGPFYRLLSVGMEQTDLQLQRLARACENTVQG